MSFPNLKGLMQVGLLLLICVEAGYMSHKTVNDRDTLTAQDLESKIGYNDYTIEALDYIKSIDNGFYRVEKNYNSGLAIHSSINDALIQDFKSTGSYHSFNNKYYVDFLSSVGLLDATNENATRWIRGVKNRPLLMVLMHTKYYLAKSDQFQLYGFNKIHQVGDVSIFKNSFFVDFGIAMDQYMARDKFEALASITQKDISLMRSFVLEKDQIARYKDELTEFDPSNIGESYSSENMSQDIASHLDENLKVVDFKDYRIKGSIQVDKPKMLFVSTAFDKGWSATVNGQSVEVERVNIGFTGVMLQAGENEVVLTYRPPFYRLSLILTLACLIFYGFLILRSRRSMKKRSVAPES